MIHFLFMSFFFTYLMVARFSKSLNAFKVSMTSTFIRESHTFECQLDLLGRHILSMSVEAYESSNLLDFGK